MDEDLKSYFDQQFSAMKQDVGGQLQQLQDEVRQVKGEVQQVKGEVQQVKGEVQQVKGEVRQAHVLIEGLQDQVRLVAEGVANCNEQLQRHREEVSGKLDLCENLDLRVRRLEAAGDLPPTGSLRRSRAR